MLEPWVASIWLLAIPNSDERDHLAEVRPLRCELLESLECDLVDLPHDRVFLVGIRAPITSLWVYQLNILTWRQGLEK